MYCIGADPRRRCRAGWSLLLFNVMMLVFNYLAFTSRSISFSVPSYHRLNAVCSALLSLKARREYVGYYGVKCVSRPDGKILVYVSIEDHGHERPIASIVSDGSRNPVTGLVPRPNAFCLTAYWLHRWSKMGVKGHQKGKRTFFRLSDEDNSLTAFTFDISNEYGQIGETDLTISPVRRTAPILFTGPMLFRMDADYRLLGPPSPGY